MAGWVDLGRVMALPKGEYVDSKPYEINDYVTFNRGAFICRKACSGIAPVVGQTTEYWQEFGPALRPATKDDLGVVKSDDKTINVKTDGTVEATLDVKYDKETKKLTVTDKDGNTIGLGTLIESSGAADVEFDHDTQTLYLIDDNGEHIGNGAHIEIAKGVGVLEVDWGSYLAAKETYDAMDVLIICPDAPDELTANNIGCTDGRSVQTNLNELNNNLAIKNSRHEIIKLGAKSISIGEQVIKAINVPNGTYLVLWSIRINDGGITKAIANSILMTIADGDAYKQTVFSNTSTHEAIANYRTYQCSAIVTVTTGKFALGLYSNIAFEIADMDYNCIRLC